MALMSIRLNMSTIAHRPRIFSNKENHSSACSPRSRLRSLRSARLSPSSLSLTSTSVSSRSSKSKAKLSLNGIGIGKAPRRAGTVHGVKPYERTTSITRAKKRATSPAKITQPQSIHHVRSAPVSASAQETMMATGMITREAKVPLRLPRPIIPVVQNMPGELAGIPPVYVLHRLTPHLHSLLYVASQYVPLASSSIAPGSSASRIPFGLPRVMQGDVSLGAKIKGREPNICLVIRDANDPYAPGKLVPVSSNVYAAQCAFWPRSAPTAASSSTSSLIPTLKQLDSIAEINEEDASFDSSLTTETSSTSDAAEIHDSTAASGVVNLPLQPLTVPHPTSFPALHLHLHLPARPLFPVLLAFPSTITSSEHADLPKLLQGLSIQEMLRRLEWIRGFWGNVCALGISSDRTWFAMSEAWGAVVAEMIRRSSPAK